ncbi:MAG TPA: hypothetical protein VD931_00495 [Baekduia sp.]|nr:hypothetical protein [Baekduia sp.]
MPAPTPTPAPAPPASADPPLDPSTYGAVWRAEVTMRVGQLRHEVRDLRATLGPGTAKARHLDTADGALDVAVAALAVPSLPARLARWWTGSSVTVAWESVHRADAEIIEACEQPELDARVPRLRAWLRQVLDDPEHLKEQLDALGARPAQREVVREAQLTAMEANNDRHTGLRQFRNLLLSVSGGLLLLLGTIAVWHAISPSFVSLCADGAGPDRCFGGGSEAAGRTVFEVLAVGALGGLLSVAFLLQRLRRVPSRYNVRAAQALLKPVAGAATALVGVLLLQSGLVVSPVENGPAALIAYSAIFGFAQELLTRYVDRQASRLLGDDT